MSLVVSNSKAKSAAIYASITRANGKIENRGLISYYHQNPGINWLVNTYIKLKDKLHGR